MQLFGLLKTRLSLGQIICTRSERLHHAEHSFVTGNMERKGVSVDGVAVHVGVSGEGNIGRGGVAGVLMFINTTFMVLVDLFESELLNDGADTL